MIVARGSCVIVDHLEGGMMMDRWPSRWGNGDAVTVNMDRMFWARGMLMVGRVVLKKIQCQFEVSKRVSACPSASSYLT